MWVAWWALAAGAAPVRATVTLGPDGPVVVSVRASAEGRAPTATALPSGSRSLILPDGGGVHAEPERSMVRVRLRWPEDAARLGLRVPPSITPLPPGPITATPVDVRGDPAERLDLLILGDGYAAEDQDRFAADVDALVDYLHANVEPYARYADLLNIWRVDLVSGDSGVDHPSVSRDTALGCAYDCFGVDRLVCCFESTVLATVDAALPDADGVLVLINDPEYGGSGGFTYATAYNGTDGLQVAAHELGHTLVGLWDEYNYGVNGEGDGPNCSSDPDGHWDAWIGTRGVGAFPECSFSNLVRPTDDACMMRTLRDGYCPVCREQVLLTMYAHLPGLVRSADPPRGETLVVPADAGPTPITLELVPDPAHLEVSWFLDGVPVLDGDPAPDLRCTGWNGLLTASVVDPTTWVREDPESLLREEIGPWTVQAEPCEEEVPLACGCATGRGGGWLVGFAPLLMLRRRR